MIKKVPRKNQYEDAIGLHYLKNSSQINAFLTNFKTSSYYIDDDEQTAILCYFQDQYGEKFKAWYLYQPYFYVGFQESAQTDVRAYIQTRVPKVDKIQLVEKIDLDDRMHLLGNRKPYLKVSFKTVSALTNARNPLKGQIDRRKKKAKAQENYYLSLTQKQTEIKDIFDLITDIRQFDVPFHSRVCIDTGLRAGKWFNLQIKDKVITKLSVVQSKQSMPQLKILAYDIQTSKAPLKFPDSQVDQVIMISFAYEGNGYLIVNGAFCGQKVQQFYYTPIKKQEFACDVEVFNQQSQKATLLRFAECLRKYNPTIITTFNGDKFDYPFIVNRCVKNYINFQKEFGVKDEAGQFYGSFLNHMDCYYWVVRDAYLPHGSHGLKAVTKAKLHYQPEQIDPQLMVECAKNNTAKLAHYAVSDAIATYYLYVKHIHGFIFALSTIIPMTPDEVLRRGSGTLCQNLLMVEAFNRNIIFPNKYSEKMEKFYKGNLLDSQTYTGGRVQCLRTGVYRADFKTDFCLQPQAFQELIDSIDELIKFAIIHQAEQSFENVQNFQEIKEQLIVSLSNLRDVKNPKCHQTYPLIYHLDVAAMYPNIILTNRLQPVAVVNQNICSNCVYNSPQNDCKRDLEWQWKGELFPLKEAQYMKLKQGYQSKRDISITDVEFEKQLKTEVRKYCQKVYKKIHISQSEVRTNTVCMRENSFYVDTVRAFRDRRYQFKKQVKIQKGHMNKFKEQKDYGKMKQSQTLMALYESMQLAHKIILNSFYGYVMRKGSRWYSMETAAMVTYIGSNIISDSKKFIENRIGKPLQLDTDGIWLMLPKGFPQNLKIKFKNGKTFNLSYPCHILNRVIYQKYANRQYQDLNQKKQYQKRKEMTIFFEIDGPYKAMMIPSAKEKQKTNQLDIQQQGAQMLKKRYAVFNFKNQISQFKGFEMKRRGQLQITKIFQEKIFDQYVKGENLEDCYKHCATTAQKYISIITKKAMDMEPVDIIGYFEESRVLSRDIEDYGKSKGLAITSATRLAEFLGPQVIKGKNICCKFVISAHPRQSPVTQRAIPTLIFEQEQPEIQKKFLYKWTKQETILEKQNIDIRDILDWDYYYERLSTQVLKMICIPAVLQGVANPIPEIQLPQWLKKKTFDMRRHKQSSITGYNLVSRQKQLEQSKQIENVTPLAEIRQEIRMQKINKNPHSFNKNFKGWLHEQKRIWKNRKREVNINYGNYKHSDMKSVLQIIPDKTHGNFTVWYWAGGRIQQMLVNMKRRYFMKNQSGLKHAPREEGQAIQVVIQQEVFAKQQDCYDSLMGRSFYETKLPLLTTLIMNKGNLWKSGKSLSIYNQSDIQQIFGQEYLPGLQRDFLPSIYLVRLEVLKNRTVWAIIKPKFDQYYFIFVDKAIGSSSQELHKFTRKIINNNEAKIQILHKSHEKQAAEFVNQLLIQYQKQLKNKFIVMLQADQSVQYLQKIGVTTLESEIPVLFLGDVARQKIQILQWKTKIIKTILKESSLTGSKLSKLLSWSRFSHVPICNLSQQKQQLDYITNLYYSRLLHSGDHLTWWNQYNKQLHISYQSTQYTGKIVNPGLYSSHCFVIEMENFAVNAIANAQQLTNFDPETAAMINTTKKNVQQKSIEHVDETMRVRTAFQYLRKMVKGWIKDIKNHSQQANNLVTNLHKWITTQSNSMYDPLLTKMVNDFMKRVFYRLLGKLANLGLQIVSANFSRMILATGKHTLQQARSKIHYCLNKCTQQDQKLFPYIIFSPNEAYRSLIYRDQHNYQGIIDSALRFEFDMCNLLCKQVGNHLQYLLIYFLENMHKISESLVQKFGQNAIQLHQNYEKEFVSELKIFIIGGFNEKVVKLVKQLWSIWRIKRQQYKSVLRGQAQTQQQDEQSIISADQQPENDSFVVDSIQLSNQNKGQKMDIEKENKIANQHNPRKNKPKLSQDYLIDIQRWSKDHQIDLLIENLFSTLCHNDIYKDELQFVRKQAMSSIQGLKPCLNYRSFNPIYPRFQLPCKVCCSVNQNPGQCQHCGQPGSSSLQLQRTVWKMMQQQQNKDLYCSWCKRIKEQYLRKCGCGGTWVFKQNPMGWLPYQPRVTEEWQFVNKVLQFMGLDNQEPKYPVTCHKPQTFVNDL